MVCDNSGSGSSVWAVIVTAIIALIICGIINAKVSTRRRRKLQQEFLPFVKDSIRTGVPYNVYLGDGRKFLGVELVGTSDASNGEFPFDWTNMLIIKQSNGKRVFIRQSAVRSVEEV